MVDMYPHDLLPDAVLACLSNAPASEARVEGVVVMVALACWVMSVGMCSSYQLTHRYCGNVARA